MVRLFLAVIGISHGYEQPHALCIEICNLLYDRYYFHELRMRNYLNHFTLCANCAIDVTLFILSTQLNICKQFPKFGAYLNKVIAFIKMAHVALRTQPRIHLNVNDGVFSITKITKALDFNQNLLTVHFRLKVFACIHVSFDLAFQEQYLQSPKFTQHFHKLIY